MSQLIKYEAACRALAECKSIDEAKSWTDKAAAMQAYGRMAKDRTLEVDAAEIRIRAERRLGEMLAASDLQTGGRPASETGRQQRPVSAPTLAEAGISKDLSARAQKLAAVPEAEFEAVLAEKRERDRQEGARVSARLQDVGARAMRKSGASTEAPEQEADEAGDFDPVAELQQQMAINAGLQAQIKAAEADDLKAEAMKWRRAYEHAQRTADDKMANAARLDKELQALHNRMLRIGKLFGERDPAKIPALVESFFRQHAKVAA